MNNIAIYGGTFDPPHYGHLKTAWAVQCHMHFNHFIFLPCKSPVLKGAALASSEQRIDMLQLALLDYPDFEIDSREIKRDTPSFMVETLQSFRKEYGVTCAVTLCLGMDAFMRLPEWYEWQNILELSHLLVLRRSTVQKERLSETIQSLLIHHETSDKNNLRTKPYGMIYRFDAGQFPISSSWLRNQVRLGQNIDAYLPTSVTQYIKKQALYLSCPAA